MVDSLVAMGSEWVQKAASIEAEIAALPQVPIVTQHVIHAGVYTRTVKLPKGTLISGALVKRSTNLIINGNVLVKIGQDTLEYDGFVTIVASANRKQIFYAKEDTHISMYFSTNCATVEEAEREFTDEYDKLASHRDVDFNEITITGE